MARATIHTTRPDTLEIEYETFGSPDDPALLLVMGFAVQLIHWETELCERLADAGRYVIRFDNRDIGLSSKLDGEHVDPMAVLGAVLAGEPLPAVPYTLSDMANDGDRPARRPRHRAGPRHGCVDGRDDRADDGDRAPGPTALGHVDHERTRRSARRGADAGGPAGAADAAADRTRRVRRRDRADAGVVLQEVLRRRRGAQAGGRVVRPQLLPRGAHAPARGHLRERRPHRRPPRGDDADARDPRARRQADHPERRHRHRRGDPRRPPAVPRRHGSRPAREMWPIIVPSIVAFTAAAA